jgi:hypothetical protein
MRFFRSKRKNTRSPEAEFWRWFQSNESRLFEFDRDLEAVFDDLSQAMRKVNPDLTFEFSPVRDNGKREFVISAGGIKAAFPAVEALFVAAPVLDRWEWIKFRPRRREVTDIEFSDRTIPHSEVHYLMAKDGDKVGLVLFFEDFSDDDRSTFGNIGYLYLDQILGEYAVETQVGFIEVRSRESQHFDQARPLSELQEHFDEYWSRAAH